MNNQRPVDEILHLRRVTLAQKLLNSLYDVSKAMEQSMLLINIAPVVPGGKVARIKELLVFAAEELKTILEDDEANE